MYFIEISKCASLSSRLISRAFCVGGLGYVWIMIVKLRGRYRSILFYRISRNDFSLILTPLLTFLNIHLKKLSRHRSKMCWRMLLAGLCCRFVFAIEFFRVQFYWQLCYFFISLSKTMCQAWYLCYQFFNLIDVFFPFGAFPFRFFFRSCLIW